MTKTRSGIGDGEKKRIHIAIGLSLMKGFRRRMESIDGLYKSGNGYLNLTNINYKISSSDKSDNVDENVEQSTQR
ncbi:MAG: hypothetical protein ACLRPW_08840 [Intestinibacter sp.]